MEAAVYKKREGGNIAALFSSNGSLNMAEFCEKISKREAAFQELSVSTACLTLLAGNYLAASKSVTENASLSSCCKLLLQYMLNSLPQCGDNYLPVFKFIHSLCCGGDSFLSPDELTSLLQYCTKEPTEGVAKDELDKKEETVPPPTDDSTHAPPTVPERETKPRQKSDSQSEVQKIFDKLKVSRLQTQDPVQTPTKSTPGEEKPSKSPSLSLPGSSLVPQLCLAIMKELGGGKTLLEFVCELPVLKALDDDKSKASFLSLSTASSPSDVSEELTSVIKNLHQLKCAIQAASIVVELSPLLDPLTGPRLTSLSQLLVRSIHATTSSINLLSQLFAVKVKLPPPTAESASSEEEKKKCTTVADLFGSLSCCALPAHPTVAATKAIVTDLCNSSYDLYVKLVDALKNSTRVGSNVIQNLRTIMVYHLLNGLLPQLGVGPSSSTAALSADCHDTGAGLSKLFGHIKFSVPLVECTRLALEEFKVLCDELAAEGSDDIAGGESSVPSVFNFDVMGSHSSWQCVELLLTHLPLLRLLLSVLLGSYKRAVSLASVAPSQPKSRDTASTPIKTRTEQQEKFVRTLQASLSEKISEKVSVLDVPPTSEPSEDLFDVSTPSISSTVSSSGAVEGVYTLYSDEMTQSSEDEEETAERKEGAAPTPPHPLLLMAAMLMGDEVATPSTPLVPPPPPPPIPPRRKVADIPVPVPPRPIPRFQLQYHEGGSSDSRPFSAESLKKKPSFYMRLASIALSCISGGLIKNNNSNIQAFLKKKIQAEHVSSFAWLVQNIHSSLQNLESAPNIESDVKLQVFCTELIGFSRILFDMLNEMIMSGVMNHEYLQGVFIHELGLNTKCWPLHITPTCLSLLGRVLVCRLQQQSLKKKEEDKDERGGATAQQQSLDDPLAVGIWKGFLHSLEENACSDEDVDEDLDVTYLQLMLFVWHSFSFETRKFLLIQTAHAVIHTARAKENGVSVSPLVVSRLLLVMDYLLYQFSGPPPQLTEQVNHNLFSTSPIDLRVRTSPGGTTVSHASDQPHPKVMCYSCERQLQYYTVLSKPGVAAPTPSEATPKGKKGKAAKSSPDIKWTIPKFYNVRPFAVSDESQPQAEIDEEACKILLTLPLPPKTSEGSKAYNIFYSSLVSLICCGVDYSLQTSKLQERVLMACASNQCFSLSMNLLSNLPPSYDILSATVDGTKFSCKSSDGASVLVVVLYLGVRLRMQHVDIEDITDTLLMMGYAEDEAEEVIGRVLSVIDSTDHFLGQTINVLNELIDSTENHTMLPLMCIIALDFVTCLLTRAILGEVESAQEDVEKAGEETPLVKEEKTSEKKDDDKKDDDKKQETEEETAEEEGEEEDGGGDSPECEVVFEKFGRQLVPVLIKTALKLLQYCHVYALSDSSSCDKVSDTNDPNFQVLEMFLSLSSKNPIFPKDSKPMFSDLMAEPIKERLKAWNVALPVDPSLKEKLCTRSADDIKIEAFMLSLLELHFTAFAGSRTFDPARSLKSTLSSIVSLLQHLFDLKSSVSEEMGLEVVPLGCDVMMEFTHLEVLKLISNELQFLTECNKFKVKKTVDLIQRPGMEGNRLIGTVLADLFSLLTSLFASAPDHEVLVSFSPEHQAASLTDLVLLASQSETEGSAITEVFKFLNQTLKHGQKSPDEPYLVVLTKQVSSLTTLTQEQLGNVVKRLVLLPVSDEAATVAVNMSLLHTFVELLTQPECKVDQALGCHLLSAMLPLGSRFLEAEHSSQDKMETTLDAFEDYFESLVLLAGTNKDNGHLILVKAVEEWMPLCINLVKKTVESDQIKEKETSVPVDTENFLNKQAFVPVGALFRYLSYLTSAVQFITNMVMCTEKRILAGEYDGPLYDSESEDEAGGMGGGDFDEDSLEEQSDEEGLDAKLCTFTQTQREYANQHWYHCHTCQFVKGTGVCTVCAKVCHKGHDLSYAKYGSFFCDCGAKEDGSCKALIKRTTDRDSAGSPLSPQKGEKGFFPSKKGKKKLSKKKARQEESGDGGGEKGEGKSKSSGRISTHLYGRRSSFPSLPILKLVQQIENYKNELRQYLDQSSLSSHALGLLHQALPQVIKSMDSATSLGCNQARKTMLDLHKQDKEIEYTDSLMAATLGSQEGAFENVRLNLTGEQGQALRQLLTNYDVRRVAMCALTSVKGKRQHLCVNHDKGKLTFLQLFPILKQADSSRRKLTLTRLSTTSVPFTVISMCHNPCNEDYLVVCGLKDCQLLVLNSSGHVTKRTVLHPSVGNNGYIIKPLWIPGSKNSLVLVADSFVKIYDILIDSLSPKYYFLVLNGKIKDATVAVTEEGKFLVVMSSNGVIYSQPIIPSLNADEGPCYLTIDLSVKHPAIEDKEGQICGGGASVYYSHTLQILFFSFQSGKSFAATTNSSLTETHKIFEIPLKNNATPPGNKGPGAALTQWTEVQNHPGLVCAVAQTTSNPVVLLVKPTQIQVHELKPLPNKAKVQGMVAMRQHPSPGDPTLQRRTTLIILCEDGSLRIYVANTNSNTEYWLQPQFQPTSPLVLLRARGGRQEVRKVKKSGQLKFPVDFFEQCQLLQPSEVDYLGNDILHVYNKPQVRYRLNTADLYLANTKSGGFTIEVSNLLHPTHVMVGVRVHLGTKSLEKIPSFIEVFGRTKTVFLTGSYRWIDIPFTREESLQADKTFKLNFGPSQDPSGINFIDNIQVYARTKEAFGWPEHPPDSFPKPKGTQDGATPTEDESSDVMPFATSKSITATDKLVCNAFSVLSNHFISVDKDKWPSLSSLVEKATTLLMYNVPFQLQYHFRFLLACTVENRHLYHQYKDRTQLSHVVQCLSAGSGRKEQLMEPEYFQFLLLMLISVGKSRPDNLMLLANQIGDALVRTKEETSPQQETETAKDGKETKFSDVERISAFIHLLNEVFWQLFSKRPLSPVVAPVVNPGFIAVDLTVACMTEVMWMFVLLDNSLLEMVFDYTLKFILDPDAHLCQSAVRVLMRMLKPKKPKSEKVSEVKKVSEESPVESETAAPTAVDSNAVEPPAERQARTEAEQAEDEEKAEAREGEEGWQQVPEVPVLPPGMLGGAIGNHAVLMEQLLADPNQVIAIQGMGDEDAMMNLAIALSLNEGGGPGDGVHPAPVSVQLGVEDEEDEEEEEDDDEEGQEDEEDGEQESQQPSVAEVAGRESVHVGVVVQSGGANREGVVQMQHLVPMDDVERLSSSSPSSLFSVPAEDSQMLLRQWESVLREGTATPSESQGRGRGAAGGKGNDVGGASGRSQGEEGDAASHENQHDPNSEPEAPNDSSAEEESGVEAIVENLSQQLENSTASESSAQAEDLAAMKLANLRKQVLLQMTSQLHKAEEAGGMRNICFFQLLMFICTNMECTREDSEAVVAMIKAVLNRLNLGREDVSEMVKRSDRHEVHLMYLRFFNILMSRKKGKGEETKSSQASDMLWFLTARTLLKESHIMQFCRRTLCAIVEKPRCIEAVEEPPTSSEAEFVNPLDDLSPFFQRQYIKGHSSDVFAAYGQLLAELLLVLPCQLKKTSETTKYLPSPEFGPEWIDTLCNYMLNVAQTSGIGRRHVRKLLLHICGSKEEYRLTRDMHALKNYMKTITSLCQIDPESPTRMPVHLDYKMTLRLIEQLKACDEIASARTSNWQTFCYTEKSTLPYLLHACFVLDQGLVAILLALILTALSGIPSKPEGREVVISAILGSGLHKKKGATRDDEKTKKEQKANAAGKEVKEKPKPEPNKEVCAALVQMFMSFVDEKTLNQFIQLFLLQSNSSALRWQAHKLLHTIYQYSQSAEQVQLVDQLWKLWHSVPSYGEKATQFVDLLGYTTISTPEVLEKESLCQSYVERAISLLKRQNEVVAHHPNSHVYSQLQSLVDFDGYYLESEPCLVCNDPEIPYGFLKLQQVKSEIRYAPNMILVKLTGSHDIAQITIRISEIKRTKMVRTVNVFYSNRTVQNVIELKNKRSTWLTARSCSLASAQGEVKIDFPLPIVACNLIIEFADFYDNLQGSSEVLQCPRCQASVPPHPGVCGTCGENVYQCHKCRAINYDEKDPFLCNSCGFSKYGKFDTFLEARPCSAVDPIESEEDRLKTLSSINSLLERADSVYKLLVKHRNELDHLLTSLAGGVASSKSVLSGESGVNRGIQLLAHRYCMDCKQTYNELSKIIQGVLASRKELVKFDQCMEMGGGMLSDEEEGEGLPEAEPAAALLSPRTKLPGASISTSIPFHSYPTPSSTLQQQQPDRCFGCSSAATEHCITMLRALSFKSQTRRLLVKQNIIRELMEFNLRSGGPLMQRDIRKLLCQITRDDPGATTELNSFILSQVLDQLSHQRVNSNLASLVRHEMMLLTASLEMEDSCWEQRLRTVLRLFRKAQAHPSPVVMAGVTMPCLKILNFLICPSEPKSKQNQKKPLLELSSLSMLGDQIRVKASEWLGEETSASFKSWKEAAQHQAMTKEDIHRYKLMQKYAGIWRMKTQKEAHFRSTLRQASWLRSMLFNPSSQSVRHATCNMLASLCQGEARQRQILDLLCSFLDDVGTAGERAQQYLELLHKLSDDSSGKWKSYLAMRGVLPRIGRLITQEIDHLLVLEETTLSSDLSQGYALKMLTVLFKSFLKVERIKQHFKGKLVGMVLNGYLSLKRLVIQRTKRIDESQELLLEMLEDLTSGTEKERQEFMASCVETLKKFKMADLITPIFVFERLCNIIHPEENDVGQFFLSLEKDPQQEEFLQGRMQGNPYLSTTAGLGPLMRDVKNKICTDCELIALLEDDTGMELLVCNKIISLDLPVKEVYKKIWCAQPNHGECMRVVYRMRGLLGDATEDMVERLDDGKDKDTNEEEDYKMAAILGECGGLDALLDRLAHVKDFVQGHHLVSAALKLLGFCVRLKVNRQHLLKPHLNTLDTLLTILDKALYYEERAGNGIGAAVAEKTLEVTERILQESSSAQPVLLRSTSTENTLDEDEGGDQLQVFLKHIESPFVQSNAAVREGLLHVIPFLTFGDPRSMNLLLKHFAPHLNFEKFDQESSSDNQLYLDCFCVVASGIGKDATGDKLKDLAIEMELTPSAVAYLQHKVPQKSSTLDTTEWKACISQPSLPYVLKMLTGLCRWHTKTQLAIVPVIPELHLLEQVASDRHIGTMAENLLEAMMENSTCQAEIKKVRKATREEKKKKAMAMREKELGALGLQVNEKGQVIAKTSLLTEMESLVEEAGLKCCICLEGYKNQPAKILGVYTYTRKVTLDEFEAKPRKTSGYATVSHFNCVHYECHSAAVKLARNRDEWESAMLQNANTKCNGLLPLWGPEIQESKFTSYISRHSHYLQECTGIFDPSFHMLAHDLRLLLIRFAYEKSFSAESGGGGPQSNMYLIPYFMHVAIYVMKTTHCYQREERNLNNFLTAARDKWVASAYELDGPLYAIVQSLFIHTLAQWEENKLVLLRRLLVLAHTRSVSTSLVKHLTSSQPAEYTVYKPLLILFGLVDALQKLLKKTIDVSVTGEDLPGAVMEYIRHNDIAVLEGCDKVLSRYQEDMLTVESFGEFCDVMGLLEAIENPDTFLGELLASVTVTQEQK